MPATAMDFDLADTMPSVLDLAVTMILATIAMAVTKSAVAVMVLPVVIECQAMIVTTAMPAAVLEFYVAAAVPPATATAPRVTTAAAFTKTQGAEAESQNQRE